MVRDFILIGNYIDEVSAYWFLQKTYNCLSLQALKAKGNIILAA